MKMIRILLILLMFLSVVQNATAAEEGSGRRKTFSERIDELEAKQKSMQQTDKGVDNRLSRLEQKLEALETRSKQQDSTALAGRVTELEQKLQLLQTRLEYSLTDSSSDSKIIPKVAKAVPNTRSLAAHLDVTEVKSIPINLAEVTDIDSDESAISFDITADYFGKYIWRGQNLSDDPVIQTGASLAWKGFTVAWWSSLDTTKINGKSGEFTEHDWSLDYSDDLPFDLPFVEGVGYSVGLINYYFPTLDDAGETTEVYLGLNFDLPLSPSFTVYHDVDEIKGTYASFGIGHSIEKIAEITPDIPIGMDIGASLGWGSASYNKGYWDAAIDSDKLNDLALSVAFPFEIAGWSVTPSLNYVTLVNGSIRDTDTYDSGGNQSSDYFFAGIGISKSF